MKPRQPYFSPLLCLLLCACMVGPDYHAPDVSGQLPSQFAFKPKPSVAQAQPDWWQNFHDAAIDELVPVALKRNLDIAAAEANIRQARAQFDIQNGSTQPQLNVAGRVGRDQYSKNSENFANIPFPNPKTAFSDYRGGFDASWELDLFGEHARSIQAAGAHVDSVEAQHAAIALRISAEVVRLVVDYRLWQQRQHNAATMLQDNQQLLQLTEQLQRAGLVSESELMQANTATLEMQAALPALVSATQSSLLGLTVLTNQSQQQLSVILNATQSGIPAPLASAGLPSDLLLRRPDLRIAERQLAAATAEIGMAVAAQYPHISLMGDIGLDSISPGKFTSLASRYWNLGPQISLPLFNGGRLAAQVSSKQAARDAAVANYRQAVLAAFADSETALIRYQQELMRLTELQQAMMAQQRQLELAQKRYQLGETSQVAELQARLQQEQLQDSVLGSQQAVAENLTAVYKALGGGI